MSFPAIESLLISKVKGRGAQKAISVFLEIFLEIDSPSLFFPGANLIDLKGIANSALHPYEPFSTETSQDASQFIFVPPITPPCCLFELLLPTPSLLI